MRSLAPLLFVMLALAASARPDVAWAQGGTTTSASTPSPAPAPKLATPPKLEALVPAELPPDTVYPEPELVILLAIEVTRSGTVARVRLLEGRGEPFDGAAIRAAERFRFSPALLDTGEPVPVTVNFRMRLTAPVVERVVETTTVAPPIPEGPPVTVRGRLLEKGTRKAIVGTTAVAVDDERRVIAETTTDLDGRFELVVRTSTFTLVVAPAAHAIVEQRFAVAPGATVGDTYFAERTSSDFDVTVRARVFRREPTKTTIERDIVRTAAGTQGDALKIIQNLPGVARNAFGGGPLILRGANPGDSRTFLEGQEIPQIFHFGGLRSTFATAFLEAIDFVPGNFSPDYGRAIGGIVDVRVREPSKDLFRGEVDVNLFDAGFALEGPVTKDWSVGGAFRRSYIDAILPAVIPDDASVSFDVAPRYYDYQLISSLRIDDDNKIRTFFYGSLDRLQFLFRDPGNDPKVRGTLSTRTMFHSLQAEWSQRISSSVKQVTTLRAGTNGLSFELGPEFFFDLTVGDIALRSTFDVELPSNLTLRAGTDSRVRFVGIKLSAPQPPREGDNPVPISTQSSVARETNSTLIEPALFAELIWTPIPELRVAPSVRLDYYSALSRATVDPRLVAQYRLFPDTTIRGGVGVYQQQPPYNESDAVVGNPNVLPERSLQTSLGVEQRFLPQVSVELTGFYKAVDRAVSRNPLFGRDPDAVPYLNESTGRIFGFEILAKATFPDFFTGWIAYTFQRSFRTDLPGEEERVFSFDQPHILTMLGTFQLGSGWSAGARFRLVSGSPFAPVTSAVFDAQSGVYVPIYGARDQRLATFHQLDVRVDKTWTFDVWKLNLYLDVQNAYNRGNQEGTSYNYDFTRSQPLTGLPILPILGARAEW